jgi:hypothetical protein
MDHEHALNQLKQALQAHHQALKNLESALLEFEQSISGEATLRTQEDEEQRSVQLLSIPQLCQELEAVREGSSAGEPPQHQAAHHRMDHGLATLAQALIVLAHPPALR